jgi:hypothetical protein
VRPGGGGNEDRFRSRQSSTLHYLLFRQTPDSCLRARMQRPKFHNHFFTLDQPRNSQLPLCSFMFRVRTLEW